MDAKFEHVYQELRSEKATRRKDALKQLLAILDSPKYLQALDEATLALRPDAQVPGASWPGLAHVVARTVGEEVRAACSRKKGPDASLQRVFRLMMTRAEEGERRCGHGHLLLRRAASLFRHVNTVLEAAGPSSAIGLEYSAALRNQLLVVPEYCACSSAATFQGLLAVYMGFLEQQVEKQHGLGWGAEEAGRVLGTMAALLAAFPGDMQPVFQADCLLFFPYLAGKLGELGETDPGVASRLLAPTLAALNTFLLSNGRDVAAQLPRLHAAFHAAVLCVSGRDARLRDAAVTYLRIQLQLGTLPRESTHMQDVQEWVERELGQPAFKWGEDGREGRLLLPKQQALLLDLAAAIYFHSSSGGSEAAAGSLDDLNKFEHSLLPAPKRRRTMSPLTSLAERVASKPATWAPVVARLLLSYGLALPPEAYADWLSRLAAGAPAHFPHHFMPDEHDADATLWLLRLAHVLALAWPLHLTQGSGGGGSGSQQQELPSPAVVEEQWMAVWEGVLGYGKVPNVHPDAFAAALPVLATIARRRLVQLPPGFHKLWGVPLLDQVPTPAGLEFATAAVLSGHDAAIDGSTWQPAVLQWLRAGVGTVAPRTLTATIAAVLGLPDLGDSSSTSGGSEDTPSLSRLPPDGDRWWQWWYEDSALSAQLGRLIRGEMLMRARALMLLDRRQQAADVGRLRPEQVLAGLAPAQLQEQAALMLEERMEDVLRQAPSPITSASLHAQHNSRLVQLLSASAAALAVSTQAAAASCAAKRAVPACWLPMGGLAAKLQLALTQCGSLLAESCKRLEGLHPAEEARLRVLVAALHEYERELGCREPASSLLQCMAGVQGLFLDASSVLGEMVKATQAAAATRGMAAATAELGEDFFDDDLDVGGRAPAVARAGSMVPAGATVSTFASLAAACKMRCAALLALLGPLHPTNGCQAALHWLDKSWEPGRPALPEEAHLALVDTLVQCAMQALPTRPTEGAKFGMEACKALGGTGHGLLTWVPRHHNGRCLFAIRRVRQLVAAAARVPSTAAGMVQQLLQELVQVAKDCFVILSEADNKQGGEGQRMTGWQLRVALAEALMTLFVHNHTLLAADLLSAVLDYMKGMLDDESYDARLAGSRLVQVLFQKYTAPEAVFAELRRHLTLDSIAPCGEDNREQRVETSLFMLGETAASCEGVELDCLFLLCGHVASQGHDKALVAAILDWLAAQLGYPHRHAYAAWHQRGLLYQWVSNGWTLAAWCGVQELVAPNPESATADPGTFLAACAPALTAMLVWGERQVELLAMAEQLHLEPAALVARHFEVLMAIVYPYSLTGRAEQRQMAAKKLTGPMMAALLPVKEVNRLIQAHLVGCAAQLLLMARGCSTEGEPEPPSPWFCGHLLVRAVHSLADMGVGRSTDRQAQQALLDKMLSHGNLAAILLVNHAHLELARHPRHQAHALASMQALLELLEGRVCEAATLRYTVSILLRLLPVRELQGQCCGILSSIMSRVLGLPSAADLAPLGALLPAVLSTLVEGLEAEHSTGRPLDSPAAKGMLELVAQLTTGAPAGLKPYLRQVDPLPDTIPALQQAAVLVAAARQHITPSEQLLQFASRASSMTPGLRHRSLSALRHVLTTQQQELFAASSSSGSNATGTTGTGCLLGSICLPEVAGAAWQLAVLSSDLVDAELAEFAGELLALAGPLEPSAIAFDPAAAFSPAQQGTATPSPPAGGGLVSSASRTRGTQTPAAGGSKAGRMGSRRHPRASPAGKVGGREGGSSTWVAALQLLGDYLVDESVEVISTAQKTLRLLLATQEGQEALQQGDPALRPYLESFQHGANSADGFALPQELPATQPGPRLLLDDQQLWRCDARPYGAWLCQLACAMLGKARSPTLATCQSMAQHKPAFAELLLPHAFADLAVQPSGGTMAQGLGSLISQQLLPRLHHHPKAARLLLSCLNRLRSQYLDAKLASRSQAAAGGKGGGNAKVEATAAAEIDLWRKVYWVDVDYLELAAAAARCGAHFTALLYIEVWQEAQHGWLAPLAALASSSSCSGQAGGGASAQEAAVERLLLDTYSQVNEPDGIYAVARSHTMLSQLKRFEHEGNWSRALLSYDLVLQHLAGAGGGGGGTDSTATQQRRRWRQQRATWPPSQLGSLSVAASGLSQETWGLGGVNGSGTYEGISHQVAVAGLVRSLSQLGAGHLLHVYAHAPGVADAAEQAALSLGQWGQLGSSSGGTSGAAGFSADAALSAALAGLQAGSMDRCKQAVSGALRSLVAGLVTASLEGAAHVNPALVQLQMLQAVSEAWELLWPALPDLDSVGSPKKRRKRPASDASGDAGPMAAAAAAAAAVSCGAGGGSSGALLESVLQLWRAREAAAGAGGRYNLQLPLQGMHLQLLHSLHAFDKQVGSLVQAAVSARKTDHFAQATTSLYKLRNLLQQQADSAAADTGTVVPSWVAAMAAPDASWRVEEAKLLWAQGQRDAAVQLARSLLGARAPRQQQQQGERAMQLAYLRSLTAKWLSRTRSDSPSTVLSLMQEAAEQALGAVQISSGEQDGTACRVLYRLAHYADGLYRNIEAQKAAPEYKTAKAVIEAKRRQIQGWTAALEARRQRGEARMDKRGQYVDKEARALWFHINATTRPVDMDEAEQKLLDDKERQFLKTALLNYTRCLCTGGGYDLQVVFRIVQLWLRLGSDREVNTLVGAAFQRVPSFKFLPLVYQMASRLSAARSGPLVESGFQANLSALLVRLGCEHPHHTLYQVFSLKNGNRDREGKLASNSKANETFSYAVDLDKVAAAQEVLDRVAMRSSACREVVREMGELIDGYIELAAVPPPTKEAEEMAFPSGLRRSHQVYQHIPVTSVTLPVDPTGRYDSFPHFVAFSERIKFVGGINKPKIVTVTDSDGNQYRQLVKSGNDDLRQDAVMQQFFWLVNQFLAEQPRTQRRSLFIRTYKVVPFSPSSGLLEWVEHTQPIADYLLGPSRTGGAHARYKRPGDITWYDCYHKMAKGAQGRDPAQMRAAFDEVCSCFPPAMHHFFLESFRDPGTWFERRLAYTRSMAVNSLAGHVIGLGDRHLQNILLDTRTADAVHIDLGIAFEQGRFLNTPELVPFRLTRDLVDGMGLTGVEGVMRRCCEETLRVLRASKESILTVIEVFIHDPLYKWALTTIAAARRQHDGAGAEEDDSGGGAAVGAATVVGGGPGAVNLANADAERTLLRIKQKLEGVGAGEVEARGVEGQVQQLLQDAQDPDKLCRMYVGWQAWC